MEENLGVKIEEILKKDIKLNLIELQQNEVHTKVANIKETVSRLDSEIQVLKFRTTKFEKNVEELEEGLRDLKCGNNKLKNEVYDLK